MTIERFKRSITLREPKCANGCKHFYGGEIKHHKDCQYYPDSMSKNFDEMLRLLKLVLPHLHITQIYNVVDSFIKKIPK